MWEYKVRTYTKTRAFETDLNNLGKEGWELVAALTTGEKVRLIFKRLLQQVYGPEDSMIRLTITDSNGMSHTENIPFKVENLPNCPIEIRAEQPCK